MNNDIGNIKKYLEAVKKDFKKEYNESGTDILIADEEAPLSGLVLDNPLLESLISRRFLPYGRAYLVFGNRGDGKSAFAIEMGKIFQANGGIVVYLETENAFDKDFATKQGLDMSKVILSHPETLEEVLTAVEIFIDNMPTTFPDGETPVLIIFDSIAGTMSEVEEDISLSETAPPGRHGKVLAAFYRRITRKLSHEKCIFLAINQLKEAIGGFGGFGEEKQPAMLGGRAPLFHSSIQLKFNKAKVPNILVPDTNNSKVKIKVGSSHKITCVRNKAGIEGNFKAIEVDIMTKGGFCWFESLVEMLGKYYDSLITRSGAYYRWNIENCKYLNPDTNQEEIVETGANYLKRDMAIILANSTDCKEHIRKAFDIPDLPTLIEVEKSEIEHKAKRKRKVKVEEKSL